MAVMEPEPRYSLETRYRGYRFRSRLEARWAVFFDALGVRYRYEPEGFDLGAGLRYLPDFWLPDLRLWVEVKGDYAAYEQQRTQDKAERLVERTRHDLAMLVGDIWVPGEDGGTSYAGDDAHYVYRHFGDTGDGCALGWDNFHWWCECPGCGEIGFEFSGRSERIECPCYNGWHEKFSGEATLRLRAAYEQARAWRFDGKDGSVCVRGPDAEQLARRTFRQRHPIGEVVASVAPLRSLDGLLVGSCPLCHDEGYSAQFNEPPYLCVDPARQSWRCTACGYGGDVMRFTELYERKRSSPANAQVQRELDALELSIYLAAGAPFNINAPAQCAAALRALGEPHLASQWERGESLEALRGQHPLVDLLLDWRRLSASTRGADMVGDTQGGAG